MPIKSDPRKVTGKISTLEIDCDKDWQGMGLHNLKGLDANMDEGDIMARSGAGVYKKVVPGSFDTVLKTDSDRKSVV